MKCHVSERRMFLLFLLVGVLLLSMSAGLTEDLKNEVLLAEIVTEKGPLKLRATPSKQGKVLVEIPRRTIIEIKTYDDAWLVAYYNGQQGYVMNSFTMILEDADPALLLYKTLFMDDCGDDVLALKERLLELGYFRAGCQLTNRFNATTAERIRLFQRVNGMDEDGIASPRLQALLYSEDALANTEPLPAVQSATRHGVSSSDTSSEDGWIQEVCSCCGGTGCVCCDNTGFVWIPN